MDVFGWDLERWRHWVSERGWPAYRAAQCFAALQRQHVTAWEQVTTLGKAQREDLRQALGEPVAEAQRVEARRQEAADGTVKSLLRLHDGRFVECVSIPTRDRHTVCVSSQVGCAVGCSFCASGLNGVERDLSAGEMVYQVIHHQRVRPVTNIVFMGSGEPLFNYPNVLAAIRVLGDEQGINLGRRRITVSTSGVPEKIRRLGHDEPQITLALSLHAPDDDTRTRLVPLNKRWPVAELMAAMDDYSALVNRRITLEYVLLGDANMTDAHADGLATVAKHHRAHVNLIPFNPVIETPHQRPTGEQVRRFVSALTARGVHLTLRGQRGADIDAACGQLKRRAVAAES